jgi:protein-S-isoprenylcysteine O-methyltransferase Ste14
MAGVAEAAGLLLLIAGLGWIAWAAGCLWQAGAPVRPGARPRVLVDHGPYRFGRHPMLLGTIVSTLGLALVWAAPALALAALAGAWAIDRLHLPGEEARLRQAFGGWYSDYASSVRRWL